MLNLEEMLLAVRSPAAREDVQEAIACYTAGAYRAAIVATWTAVVYDIMAKLRELELSGDRAATKRITEFESIRTANDLKRSQEWERNILALAHEEFELLTHQELADLERLRDDRHRCAHPAMDTADEPYRPPAELVRYHLRSALVHLLVQAPVQGRAALARLAGEVKSPLFPADPARAMAVLKAGALGRPKDNLLRDFVVRALKEALTGPDRADAGYQTRLATALIAAIHLHPAKVRSILKDRLPNILRSVSESDYHRIIRLGDRFDELWVDIATDVVAKLEQFVATADFSRHPRALLRAASRPELVAVLSARIDVSTKEDLKHLVTADPERAARVSALVSRSISLLEGSRSWDTSNFIIEHLLEPMASGIGIDHLGRVAQAAAINVEVEDAFRTKSLLRAIRDAGTISSVDFEQIAQESGLTERYPEVLGLPEADGEDDDSDRMLDDPWSWSLDPDDEHSEVELPNGLTCKPDDRVVHPRYGAGTIIGREGSFRIPAVDIEFDDPNVGLRRLVVHKTPLSAVK